MLSLTRRVGQTILIGPDIEVTVLSVSGGKVRVGIAAPRSIPVHRAELVERVEEENRRALRATVQAGIDGGHALAFPEGLFGLRPHTSFVLCDLDHDTPIRCLVSIVDPNVQLYVVDAEEAWPGYPLAEARRAWGGDDEEVAVALIVHVPASGAPPTVNTLAPLVIGMESREGRQVVLEKPGLSVNAPVDGAARKAG